MVQENHDPSRPSSGFPLPLETRTRHERRDAVEHRQRILQAAQDLFARQGVQAVSMHQIAKAAGVGQGTLYRRYAHKGELCLDLLREHHEQFIHNITALFAENTNASVLERLDGLLKQNISFLEEQGSLLGTIAMSEMQETLCDETVHSQHIMPFYIWLHSLFAELLTEAVERGELANLDVPFTADAILSTLNPMFYHFQRQERGYSPERILQGLRHIFIEGMKAPNEESYPHS